MQVRNPVSGGSAPAEAYPGEDLIEHPSTERAPSGASASEAPGGDARTPKKRGLEPGDSRAGASKSASGSVSAGPRRRNS